MKLNYMALATISLVLHVMNVNAAEQERLSARGERDGTHARSEASPQGGVTIPGNSQVLKPLPPEEVEKLGREGVKRTMMEQRR